MEYITERGVKVDVVPIPLLLDKVQASHPMPDAPTYTETLAGGGRQEVEITESDAAAWQKSDPDTWAEHAEKWAAYQALVAKRADLVNDLIWKAILRKGIKVEMPADDEWIEDQRELGIDVPDNPKERRAHYIWTECIGGTRDIIRITALANGADLTEEALQIAEDSFRDQLSGQASGQLARQAGTVEPGK